MLTLYYKPSCHYCREVISKAQTLGVVFDLRNIYTDEANLNELLEKGGKNQVPFLVDTENNISMYESADIVAYLETKEGVVKNKVRVHTNVNSSNVCP